MELLGRALLDDENLAAGVLLHVGLDGHAERLGEEAVVVAADHDQARVPVLRDIDDLPRGIAGREEVVRLDAGRLDDLARVRERLLELGRLRDTFLEGSVVEGAVVPWVGRARYGFTSAPGSRFSTRSP